MSGGGYAFISEGQLACPFYKGGIWDQSNLFQDTEFMATEPELNSLNMQFVKLYSPNS